MSSLRPKLIRLAASFPKNSSERKALLEVLAAPKKKRDPLYTRFMKEEGDSQVKNPDSGRKVKLKSLRGPKGKSLLRRRFNKWKKKFESGGEEAPKETKAPTEAPKETKAPSKTPSRRKAPSKTPRKAPSKAPKEDKKAPSKTPKKKAPAMDASKVKTLADSLSTRGLKGKAQNLDDLDFRKAKDNALVGEGTMYTDKPDQKAVDDLLGSMVDQIKKKDPQAAALIDMEASKKRSGYDHDRDWGKMYAVAVVVFKES